MPRTLVGLVNHSSKTLTANSDVAGRVGFAAPVRMAAQLKATSARPDARVRPAAKQRDGRLVRPLARRRDLDGWAPAKDVGFRRRC